MAHFFSIPFSAVVRTLLALLLLAVRVPAVAQAPTWQSARAVALATAAATDNYAYVAATAVDGAGNVYLAGTFRNSVVLGGTTLTSLGNYDVFVAKFNPANNQFAWAQRAGGIGKDNVAALAVSGTNVYVAGYFQSPTASFGPATLTNVSATTGTADGYVAKLTDAGSTGSFVWAQRAGGTDNELAAALAVSGTSVYVAGYFASPTASFGPTTLANAGATGTADGYVAKLTDAGSTGSFVWAQRADGTDNELATALAVSGTSVYVAGSFQSPTVGFGPITLTSTGFADVFVAKLTDAGPTGSFIWAQGAGGTNEDRAAALAVSGPSVYVAGYFNSATAGFGSVTLTLATSSNAGNTDVFVAKLTDAGSTGSFTWAQRAGGTGGEDARALAVRGPSVYVAGSFNSPTAEFGLATLTLATSSTAVSNDVFVAKLMDAGPTGSFAWAQRAGGTGYESANALALTGTTIYVAGNFASLTADFGPITLANSNPSSNLGFLASLPDATLTSVTGAIESHGLGIIYPNPARRMATLRLPDGTAPTPLILTDALGRAVRRYPAPAGSQAALDLRGLPAGLYLLRGADAAQRLLVE